MRSYSFWKDDGAKHCYALSIALEELNGNISSSWADTVLTLLEKGYPEESIEVIAEGLSSQKRLNGRYYYIGVRQILRLGQKS